MSRAVNAISRSKLLLLKESKPPASMPSAGDKVKSPIQYEASEIFSHALGSSNGMVPFSLAT